MGSTASFTPCSLPVMTGSLGSTRAVHSQRGKQLFGVGNGNSRVSKCDRENIDLCDISEMAVLRDIPSPGRFQPLEPVPRSRPIRRGSTWPSG